MSKKIKTVEDLCKALQEVLNIPKNHHLVAVFEDNDHDDIIGFACVEDGVECDYTVYTLEQILDIYGGKRKF